MMIKIRLYIVTYKNDLALSECLESLSRTKIPSNVILEKHVINNHSNFTMNSKFTDVKVLHNSIRPDFSTGHLARNWNQAIINGFENLLVPACYIVTTCQVDTIFSPNWLNKIIESHKKYSLITAAPGDGFISYTSGAIRNIGMWDEKFCAIEYQEADYFLRALIYNKHRSSINDFHHGRVLNPILKDEKDYSIVYRKNTDYKTHTTAGTYHRHLLKLLLNKYNPNPFQTWNQEFINNPPQLNYKETMLYPYFEKNVIDIPNKYNWSKA